MSEHLTQDTDSKFGQQPDEWREVLVEAGSLLDVMRLEHIAGSKNDRSDFFAAVDHSKEYVRQLYPGTDAMVYVERRQAEDFIEQVIANTAADLLRSCVKEGAVTAPLLKNIETIPLGLKALAPGMQLMFESAIDANRIAKLYEDETIEENARLISLVTAHYGLKNPKQNGMISGEDFKKSQVNQRRKQVATAPKEVKNIEKEALDRYCVNGFGITSNGFSTPIDRIVENVARIGENGKKGLAATGLIAATSVPSLVFPASANAAPGTSLVVETNDRQLDANTRIDNILPTETSISTEEIVVSDAPHVPAKDLDVAEMQVAITPDDVAVVKEEKVKSDNTPTVEEDQKKQSSIEIIETPIEKTPPVVEENQTETPTVVPEQIVPKLSHKLSNDEASVKPINENVTPPITEPEIEAVPDVATPSPAPKKEEVAPAPTPEVDRGAEIQSAKDAAFLEEIISRAATVEGDMDPKELYNILTEVDAKYNHEIIDREFIMSAAWQESRFNPNAVSPAGAEGLVQFMPGTAADMGLTEPMNPRANVEASYNYYINIYELNRERFPDKSPQEILELTLASYNAGPNNTSIVNGELPPFAETIGYVEHITETLDDVEGDIEEAAAGVPVVMPAEPVPEAVVEESHSTIQLIEIPMTTVADEDSIEEVAQPVVQLIETPIETLPESEEDGPVFKLVDTPMGDSVSGQQNEDEIPTLKVVTSDQTELTLAPVEKPADPEFIKAAQMLAGHDGNTLKGTSWKNAGLMLERLLNNGIGASQAIGIVANSMYASEGVNSATERGLFSWDDERLERLEKYAESLGKDSKDFGVQIDFALIELQNNESLGYAELNNATKATDATKIFGQKFMKLDDNELTALEQHAESIRLLFNNKYTDIQNKKEITANQDNIARVGWDREEMTEFNQCDPLWGEILSPNGMRACDIACGATSMAKAFKMIYPDMKVTPKETIEHANANNLWFTPPGGRADSGGLTFDAMIQLANNWGLQGEYIAHDNPALHDFESYKKTLEAGKVIIVAGSGGVPFVAQPAAHFVVIRGISENGNFLVADPAPKTLNTNTTEWDPKYIMDSVFGAVVVSK